MNGVSIALAPFLWGKGAGAYCSWEEFAQQRPRVARVMAQGGTCIGQRLGYNYEIVSAGCGMGPQPISSRNHAAALII
jgi:hypothetical protein